MRLSELASVVSDAGLTGGDVDVTRITYDSREVTPGTLFVALVGEKLDGHDYIARAVKAGASAVVVPSTANAPDENRPPARTAAAKTIERVPMTLSRSAAPPRMS